MKEAIVSKTEKGYNILLKEGEKETQHTALGESAMRDAIGVYEEQGYNIVMPTQEKKQEISPSDYQMLAQEVIQLPYKIKEIEMKQVGLVRKQDAITKRLAEMEREIVLQVYNEQDPEGKKVFTNEKARDTEVARRMAEKAEVTVLQESKTNIIANIKEYQIDLELNKRLMRSIEIVTELNKIELRLI